jgi:hypothetical protein
MYIGLHVKYSLFLSDFNESWILSTDFRKMLKYQISWTSVRWEPSGSMRTDGQKADTTKLVVAFRNSANAPNNTYKITCLWLKWMSSHERHYRHITVFLIIHYSLQTPENFQTSKQKSPQNARAAFPKLIRTGNFWAWNIHKCHYSKNLSRTCG